MSVRFNFNGRLRYLSFLSAEAAIQVTRGGEDGTAMYPPSRLPYKKVGWTEDQISLGKVMQKPRS